jgi:hypothetical protein
VAGRGKRKERGGRGLGPALLVVLLVLLLVSVGLRYGGRLRDRVSGLSSGGSSERGAIDSREAERRGARPPDSLAGGNAEFGQISLQILNATGRNRLALETGERLRRWGIDAMDKADAPPWPFPETLLIVRGGRRAEIHALAQRLGGIPVIVQRREDLMLDGTLILGHDWRQYWWPEP